MRKQLNIWLENIEVNLVLLFLISSLFYAPFVFTAFADGYSQGKHTGDTAGSAALQKLGSKSGIKSRISIPMTSGGISPMSTLDNSQSFSASISAPSSDKYLELLIHPTTTGDLSPVYVYQDTDFDGSFDYSYSIPFPVSGVCANGVIGCDPGTWNNCHYYKWVADSEGRVSLQETEISDLGGCYCSNASCGSGTSTTAFASIILKDLGGGAVGAAMSAKNSVSITGVQVNTMDIIYYGQDTGNPDTAKETPADTGKTCYEWYSGNEAPSQYYDPTSGSALLSASGSAAVSGMADTGSMYNLIVTSGAAQVNPVEQRTCTINRVVAVTPQGEDQVLRFTVGTVGDNYWSSGIYTVTKNIFISDVSHVSSAKLYYAGWDDSIRIYVNDHKVYENWPGCYERDTNFRTNLNIDAMPYLINGNNIFKEEVCAQSGGSCGEGWFNVEIVEEAYDDVQTYIDDGCSALENDSNCRLKDEWVDGIQTWSNYASTGFIPVGQTCKTFTGNLPHTYCYDWWIKKRVYICKTQSYDFSKARQRAQTIDASVKNTDVSQNTLTGVSYQDYRKNENGNWIYENRGLVVPQRDAQGGCIFVCKVKTPVADTQATSQNENTSQYRSTSSYVFDYRKCDKQADSYVCPVKPGETVVKDCACIDEFAEAASIIQTLQEAGKDIICSDGVAK